MKPFNLEEAKAGKPFVSTISFDCENPKRYFIGVQKNGTIVSEDEDGLVYLSDSKDLYMYPTKRTYFTNLYYHNFTGIPETVGKYISFDEARAGISTCFVKKGYDVIFLKTIEFEVDE